MKLKRFTALVVCIIMVVCCFPFGLLSASAEGYALDYTFIGDEADVAGFAQGLITVTPDSGGAKSGYYLVYYTDGTNVLSNYDELASAKITGESVRMEIKDGTMIPEGAKGIAVFESNTEFLDNAPNISSAKAKCAIPASKQLTLSSPELVFGLASDVHVNYEYYNRGAYAKWTYALNFFNNNGAEYVFVTGDMTGDATDSNTMGSAYTLENQYKKYKELVEASPYSTSTVFECIGNHGNTNSDNALFTKYTSSSNEVHPYSGSPYYYVMIEGKTSTAKDNLFIFMQQDLDDGSGGYVAGNTATRDNFSKAQIDWLENLLATYGNHSGTNVFILEHSPFLDYGAGEKYGGLYRALTTFSSDFPQNMRLKALLEKYKDVTVFSGHTHQTFYDNLNYSDMANTFARTVHVGSTCWPRAYNESGTSNETGSDGRKTTGASYGSEAYLVKVYKDYVVYTGYNLSTNKIIPCATMIVPTKAKAVLTPDQAFEGSGTETDPYLIQNESDFMLLTNGFNQSNDENAKYGEGKYFEQTADINMIGIESYIGTHANGNAKCYFAGNYNGNGYEIKVDIRGPEQRSVFPYIYGVIYNVTIRGNIISDVAAQPIRTSRGYILNSIFDVYLRATNVHGIVYSNYTYLFNVYATGSMNGTSMHPVAYHDDPSAYYGRVYHYFADASGNLVYDAHGTRTNNLTDVAKAFNIRDDADYRGASYLVNSGVLSKAGVLMGKLMLGHDGNEPVVKIPTTGNIAKYGSYTLSRLYRMGGADVGWGWDSSAPIAYPDETGSTLTDGQIATALGYGDPAWIGFHSATPDYTSAGYHSIKFNFDTAVNIKTVNIYVGTVDIQNGVTSPDKITALCDGSVVASVVPTDKTNVGNAGTEKVVINIESGAKELELRLENAQWAFVSEVEIIAYVPDDHKCAGAGEWQSDENGHWKNCSCGKKTDEASHDSGNWVTVNESALGVEGKKELKCTVCGYVLDTVETTAIGDLSGDGQISATDYLRLKKACFGTYTVEDITIADLNGNNRIDATDYFMLKRYVFTH